MSYAGRCACGQVTVAIAGEPVATRQCWCAQCRKIAAGGPTHNAMVRTEELTVAGALKGHAYVAASGNTLTLSFCPECGTHVLAQSSARPQFRTIRFGILDEPHGLRPRTAIWTDEAPDWACLDPTLHAYPRQPPPPGTK